MKAAVKLATLVLVVQGNTDLQAGAQNTTAADQRRQITQRKTQLARATAKKSAAKAGQKKPEGLTHRKKWLLAAGLAGLGALAYYTSGAAVPLETSGSAASEGPLPNPYPEGYLHNMNNAYYHNGAQGVVPPQAATTTVGVEPKTSFT